MGPGATPNHSSTPTSAHPSSNSPLQNANTPAYARELGGIQKDLAELNKTYQNLGVFDRINGTTSAVEMQIAALNKKQQALSSTNEQSQAHQLAEKQYMADLQAAGAEASKAVKTANRILTTAQTADAVVMTAGAITAGAIGGTAGMAAWNGGMGTLKNLTETAINLGMGYKTGDQALHDFGSRLASDAIATGTGAAMAGIGGVVVSKVAGKIAQPIGTLMASQGGAAVSTTVQNISEISQKAYNGELRASDFGHAGLNYVSGAVAAALGLGSQNKSALTKALSSVISGSIGIAQAMAEGRDLSPQQIASAVTGIAATHYVGQMAANSPKPAEPTVKTIPDKEFFNLAKHCSNAEDPTKVYALVDPKKGVIVVPESGAREGSSTLLVVGQHEKIHLSSEKARGTSQEAEVFAWKETAASFSKIRFDVRGKDDGTLHIHERHSSQQPSGDTSNWNKYAESNYQQDVKSKWAAATAQSITNTKSVQFHDGSTAMGTFPEKYFKYLPTAEKPYGKEMKVTAQGKDGKHYEITGVPFYKDGDTEFDVAVIEHGGKQVNSRLNELLSGPETLVMALHKKTNGKWQIVSDEATKQSEQPKALQHSDHFSHSNSVKKYPAIKGPDGQTILSAGSVSANTVGTLGAASNGNRVFATISRTDRSVTATVFDKDDRVLNKASSFGLPHQIGQELKQWFAKYFDPTWKLKT